jgi:hypothetical protein
MRAPNRLTRMPLSWHSPAASAPAAGRLNASRRPAIPAAPRSPRCSPGTGGLPAPGLPRLRTAAPSPRERYTPRILQLRQAGQTPGGSAPRTHSRAPATRPAVASCRLPARSRRPGRRHTAPAGPWVEGPDQLVLIVPAQRAKPIGGAAQPITMLTEPTPIQRQAFELIGAPIPLTLK